MEFSKRQIQPGVVVIEMTGSIRIGPNCQQIERMVEEVIGQHETRVVFDLSGVSFVDSSGIGTLVRCLAKLKTAGGTLRLTGVKGMVGGVLKLTQIDRVLEVYPTAADALRDLPAAATS
jgi:anti-sigma B factor antagonist